MAWTRASFRGSEVLASCGPDGAFVANPDGFVPFVYRAGGKQYKTRPENLQRLPGAPVSDDAGELQDAAPARTSPRSGGAGRAPKRKASIRSGSYEQVRSESDAFQVWTDGACSGNPGPSGLGVVVVFRGEVLEKSQYLGIGTNNIAELTAILRGLEMVKERDPAALEGPVDVLTDSSYCIGLLTKGWKAKKNQALVASLRACAAEFGDIRLLKVPGHAGVPLNERADELARQAITDSAGRIG